MWPGSCQGLPIRLATVEIRSVGNMELITAIEILSPVNKRPSHEGTREYQHKRRKFLHTEANLIEIILLRGGTRPVLDEPVPEAPYYITLSRADQRPNVTVWPIQFSNALPAIPVPLAEPDSDVWLEMGKAVATVYERGGYAAIIDYHRSIPSPRLHEEDEIWIDEYLLAQEIR